MTSMTPTKTRLCVLEADDPRHGTVNGYANQHCRCELCRAAHRTDQSVQRAKRIARTVANGGIAPPPAKHGAPSTYGNWRCSCEPCREAHTRASQQRKRAILARKRLADAWRTPRRRVIMLTFGSWGMGRHTPDQRRERDREKSHTV